MPRVVISSPSQSDSTETEESSSFEVYSPPAEESSTDFGGFVHQLFADPSGFSSHLPASSGLDSPSFSPLARGPGEFEDVELFPSQPSILKESDLSLVCFLLGPSVEVILDTSRPVFDPPAGGYVALSFLAVKYGFCVPLPPLFNEVCRYFNLVHGQLSPNSFRFVATFLSLCDSLSIPPTLSLFTQLFNVVAMGSRSPDSIQIVPREGLRFDGIIKSFKRWKERFVFVQVTACIGLKALENAGLLPTGATYTGSSCSGIPSFGAVGLSAPISCLGAIPSEMASWHDILRGQFRRLTRSHTARSAAPPPLPTKGLDDKGKKHVDEPSAPPAFASSPPCALADLGALRKRARAEPAEKELSSSLPQPLTLVVTGWTDSSMCGTRFNYDPLEWGEKVVFPCVICRLLARKLFTDVEASRRSLTTQVELRQARREAEEGHRVAEESHLSAVSDYQNSYKFRQDALASIRGASDDFALIGKDWLASPEGVQYTGEMSLEDYYEGSRYMQQEIYATLWSSNPSFMPADLGLPPPFPSWANRHSSEGPGSAIQGSGVASEAHPPGFALSSDSGGRREIHFDQAYLNSTASLQILADLSNAEIFLGSLDSVDGTGPQDVRGDVSSQAPSV
nr:predicted protein [Ipomoea batatas]